MPATAAACRAACSCCNRPNSNRFVSERVNSFVVSIKAWFNWINSRVRLTWTESTFAAFRGEAGRCGIGCESEEGGAADEYEDEDAEDEDGDRGAGDRPRETDWTGGGLGAFVCDWIVGTGTGTGDGERRFDDERSGDGGRVLVTGTGIDTGADADGAWTGAGDGARFAGGGLVFVFACAIVARSLLGGRLVRVGAGDGSRLCVGACTGAGEGSRFSAGAGAGEGSRFAAGPGDGSRRSAGDGSLFGAGDGARRCAGDADRLADDG